MGICAQDSGPTEGRARQAGGLGVSGDFEAQVSKFRGAAGSQGPSVLFCLWGLGLGNGCCPRDTPCTLWSLALPSSPSPPAASASFGEGSLGKGYPQGGSPGTLVHREEARATLPLLWFPGWGPESLALVLGRVEAVLGKGHSSVSPTHRGLLWVVDQEHCGCPPLSWRGREAGRYAGHVTSPSPRALDVG